jgi:CHASE3 domain sensor protein
MYYILRLKYNKKQKMHTASEYTKNQDNLKQKIEELKYLQQIQEETKNTIKKLKLEESKMTKDTI